MNGGALSLAAATALLLALAVSSPVSAGERSERGDEAGAERGAVARELQTERERRAVERLLDDLRALAAAVDGEIGEMDRRIDAILPLESPRREADLRDLVFLYRDYRDRLGAVMAEAEADLVYPLDPRHPAARIGERYREAVRVARSFGEAIQDTARELDRELQRLNRLLDRKRFLAEQIAVLEERLARIEERLAERELAGRKEDERRRGEIRVRVRHLQNELLALADVDEGLLKHYAVLVEHGRLEAEWLALAAERFERVLRIGPLPAAAERTAVAVARYREMIRFCEGEIDRLRRHRESLDRREERISTAGTLRELDRSRELAELYERLAVRYEREIGRLRVRAGAYEAELAELLSRER
jgi:hypothetical protein